MLHLPELHEVKGRAAPGLGSRWRLPPPSSRWRGFFFGGGTPGPEIEGRRARALCGTPCGAKGFEGVLRWKLRESPVKWVESGLGASTGKGGGWATPALR